LTEKSAQRILEQGMPVETQILDTTEEGLEEAGSILREGGLVVFPTETVYGLGANALNPEACRNIFRVKGRPADNPLIVHLSSLQELPLYTREVPDTCFRVMERCVPGPVTFVLPKASCIPDIVTAGLPTVAIRIPAHEEARKLIRYAGVPIAAPSANRSGEPSPTTFEMAHHAMFGRVNAILRGESCRIGLESSVIQIRGNRIELLRPGFISLEDLAYLGQDSGLEVADLSGSTSETAPPPSPGMKYLHYKPKATVYLFSSLSDLRDPLEPLPPSAIVLCTPKSGTTEDLNRVREWKGFRVHVYESLKEYARDLFAQFHEADKYTYPAVLAWYPPTKGIGLALRNRLIKASGGRFL
jgi:L-threonylcarbamoyladenylate synthase